MKARKWIAPVLTLLAGAVGFWLRQRGLVSGFDSQGLNIESGDAKALVTLSGAVAAWALAWGVTRKPQPLWQATFQKSIVLGGLETLSALLLMISAFGSFSQSDGTFQSAVSLLGIAAGLCLLWGDIWTFAGKRPNSYGVLVPVVYLVCLLIYHFRLWSVDPVVSDYCYRLFALIGAMVGIFALGSYTFDQGNRRLLCAFGSQGAFFCLVSLADGGSLSQQLLFAAFALRLLCGISRAAGAEELPEESSEDEEDDDEDADEDE